MTAAPPPVPSAPSGSAPTPPPFELVGDPDAGACVDGVCAVPTPDTAADTR